MSTSAMLSELQARITAGYPILFCKTHEESRWEQLLAEAALEIDRGLIVWIETAGWSSDPGKAMGPEGFTQLEELPEDHVLLVKDAHRLLDSPLVLRRLRDAIPLLAEKRQTLVFLDPVGVPPDELSKQSVRLTLPLPFYEDLQAGLDELIGELEAAKVSIPELAANDTNRLIQGVLGLTAAEARNAWKRALWQRPVLDDEALSLLIAEKRTLAGGSAFLDFYDLDESVGDVGGLDQLKDWLSKRAEAYTPRAREQGVPLPKGVMLLGVQGCGKSLTARATARLLSFPLIRLEIGNLLGAQRGESERNLRSVLALLESISPVVLWLDELEKGFAGVVGEEGVDATMTRLVGQLLTWMSDLDKPVFVVATANSINQLPPEMLRRGRFDELFFIDLPNWDERRSILKIHLEKRGWKSDKFPLDELANTTEGFSGAELEQVVVSALIDAFGEGRIVTAEDLDRSRRTTVPLSVTMEDQVFALRQWAQDRCRRATSDNRVAQMLDSESRQGLLDQDDKETDGALPPWAQLAAHGQIKAAIVDYVRRERDVLFSELTTAFLPYIECNGEFGLAVRTNPNMVLWTGLSKELCDLICELVTSKRLYVHPTAASRYAGTAFPELVPLRELTDEAVPRPSWLASSLRVAPHAEHAGRLARIGRMKLARG
ncbi:MAG: AAA family ATPase [Planctomycetaceae bacterium]|nr:AAA family ATPase [Planctomycetaceae bacterium]